jgi:hypothetical protein
MSRFAPVSLLAFLFLGVPALPVALAHDSIAAVYAQVSPAVVVVRAEGRALPSTPGEQPAAFGSLGVPAC